MWPWWLGAGLLTLACGISMFALVGWATYRARRLDDPAHPYLPPLHRPRPGRHREEHTDHE